MIAMICINKKIKVDFLAKFKLLIATEGIKIKIAAFLYYSIIQT